MIQEEFGHMEYKEIFRKWIQSPTLSTEEKQNLANMSNEDVYEAFYKYAEFGTAGMRAVMGLGTNKINKYIVRMAAKGLAQFLGEGTKVAIAYDTRHNSKEFAWETARVLAASGIEALVFDRVSPVPLLSFTIRELKCDGGVVITASHNTKEYNGFKVFDKTGCQIDNESSEKIAKNMIRLTDTLNIGLSEIDDVNIKTVPEDVIIHFIEATENCCPEMKSDLASLKIVYTSLHGSGRDYVMKSLTDMGFSDVILTQQQADYNGEFPTVKKPNPEEPEAFKIAEQIAIREGADIIVGTDPDCDRMGIGIIHEGKPVYLTGNQIGVILIDFLARTGNAKGRKLITTVVTGDMGSVVASDYGIETLKTFIGFKNIGKLMNSLNPEEFFMGYEESYGYLISDHVRDKDGVSAVLAACKAAVYWKDNGKTLVDVLEMLYQKYGYWIDTQKSFVYEGSCGVEKMKDIMENLRKKGGESFAQNADLKEFLDYNKGIDGLSPANILKYIFVNGSWIAIRPSGTEPKIKVYFCIRGEKRHDTEKIYHDILNTVKYLIG